jgi:hypothetical protein
MDNVITNPEIVIFTSETKTVFRMNPNTMMNAL